MFYLEFLLVLETNFSQSCHKNTKEDQYLVLLLICCPKVKIDFDIRQNYKQSFPSILTQTEAYLVMFIDLL